jgi:hypothetical protein
MIRKKCGSYARHEIAVGISSLLLRSPRGSWPNACRTMRARAYIALQTALNWAHEESAGNSGVGAGMSLVSNTMQK